MSLSDYKKIIAAYEEMRNRYVNLEDEIEVLLGLHNKL
jgi:hypothetical protein